MEYKPDWDEARERFVAWWNHSSLDRATLLVRAPRPINVPPAPRPSDVQTFWTDPDYRIAAAEHSFATTYYGGESFPWFDTNIGPGSLALYLGSPAVLHDTTVWYEPIADTPAAISSLRFDPDNIWWKTNVRLAEEGMKRGRGRYLTSFPDLIENLDILASLVGVRPLLYALKDAPEEVKRLNRQINDLYFRYYDEFYDLLDGDALGTCFCAFQIWGPGRVAKLQCDFSAMISPEMFWEFVVPDLTEQVARLDYTVYHLDGPDAICHLDALLTIPGLNAIQWTPGAGQPGGGDEMWWPMYRKILDAGKGVHIGVAFEQVEAVARHLGRDGVYVASHAPSVEAADDLLRRAATW